MKVLGLGTEGDSGAAVVEDGRILAAVNEERLCRMKLVEGFPRGSIREVLELSDTTIDELDAVMVGTVDDSFVPELHPFEGWFEAWEHSGGLLRRVKRLAGTFSRFRDRLPILEDVYYALMEPTFRRRRRGIRRLLREEFGVRCPVEFVDHHFCHVTSAYFTAGHDDALVVSMDGGGDARSALLYTARDGDLEFLHEVSAYDSLGNYYAYVTELCGFQAHKHEGKITGLAARGEPVYVPLLREFVDEEDGTIVNRSGLVFMEAIRELRSRLPEDWAADDLAASIQQHFEDVVTRFVTHWVRETGHTRVSLAGGVFANVRVNQEVHALPEIEDVFVHPGMTDGGLPVGAALAACAEGILPRSMTHEVSPIRDVYLGPEFTDEEIDRALEERGLEAEPVDGSLEDRVAELLARGYVVARASGRMEYGPRALGNRSILYHPTDPSVNDWLNEHLDRTEFMPFAPAVLYEERDRCFEDVAGAEHPAEFMTITFDCTRWMKRHMPGVVHVDGTARPQLVRREVNPGFHRIIASFYEKTGLPGIINTSFNMHEEPIVCSAGESIRAFLAGNLDFLALGTRLVEHPEGVQHPVRPAERASEPDRVGA